MTEWTNYVRQNLRLHGLRPEREAEIIEDLAQQLEDAYREALAGGMAEADAVVSARQHVPDWDSLNWELQGVRRGTAPALEQLWESADTASRSRVLHGADGANRRRPRRSLQRHPASSCGRGC
jgi:hypothetical protein